MESKSVAPFLMGPHMNLSGELRDRITIDNNKFTEAYKQFMAKKTADAIRRRYHDK